MARMYTIKELDQMRKETRNVIAREIKRLTEENPLTAKELSEKIGLCSSYHIANTISMNSDLFHSARYLDVPVRCNKKKFEKIRHLGEFDDDGNLVKTWDERKVYSLMVYQAT